MQIGVPPFLKITPYPLKNKTKQNLKKNNNRIKRQTGIRIEKKSQIWSAEQLVM